MNDIQVASGTRTSWLRLSMRRYSLVQLELRAKNANKNVGIHVLSWHLLTTQLWLYLLLSPSFTSLHRGLENFI
jgi:hypothetical protein